MRVMDLYIDAMLGLRPRNHRTPTWLGTFVCGTWPREENQRRLGTTCFLRHDCLQHVLLKLTARVRKSKSDFNNGLVLRNVKVHSERVLAADPLLAIVAPEPSQRTFAKSTHESARCLVSPSRP